MVNKSIIQDAYISKLKKEIAAKYSKATYLEFKELFLYIDIAYGLGYEAHDKRFKGRSKKVIRSDGKEFDSVVLAAKDVKLNRSNLYKALRYGHKFGGYKWSYAIK